LVFQALPESPATVKNGSAVFVQAHSPAMNGGGMHWGAFKPLFAMKERTLCWSNSMY